MITPERLLEKISSLPMRQIEEVEDFVDFLAARSSAAHVLSDEEKDRMIVRYASEFGGTDSDLDEALQEAGLETIAAGDREKR